MLTTNYTNDGYGKTLAGGFANDLEALSKVGDGYTHLRPVPLLQLVENGGYTQMRFSCHKPAVGRTIDVATNKDDQGKAVLNYFLKGVKGVQPPACGSYYKLEADTSILFSRGCNFNHDKWGLPGLEPDISLIEHALPYYIKDPVRVTWAFEHHNRWNCDDALVGGDNADGTWLHYIR